MLTITSCSNMKMSAIMAVVLSGVLAVAGNAAAQMHGGGAGGGHGSGISDHDHGQMGQQYGSFIDQQYMDFMNREADSGGWHYYLDHLGAGTMTLDMMVGNFMASPEFMENNGFIARCYFGIFNDNMQSDYHDPGYRYPDYGGQQYWNDQMNAIMGNGGSLMDAQMYVIEGFISSPEWQHRMGEMDNEQFVEFLYEQMLGRMPDTEGYHYHLANLNDGTVTHEELIWMFIVSDEAVMKYSNHTYVTMAYLGMLDREADRGGFVYHLGRLSSGETDARGLLNGFIYAPEYYYRLQSMGVNHPDPDHIFFTP